jgi:hypothetical protein
MRPVSPPLLAWLALLPLAGAALAQPSATELAVAAPSHAAPAARPFGGSAGQVRLPPTLNEPLRLIPPNASVLRSEPAPVPNREIEAPTGRPTPPPAATVEPMLLPPERNQGMTFGREHLRDAGTSSPFDAIVPGARLRIPFESSPPSR